MSNWSELLYDLLVGIVERIEKLEDFIIFGAVCKSWSRAGIKEHFKGLWLRRETPYLMHLVRNENDDIRQFYSLVEGKIMASIRIPKFKGTKCNESLGWLLAIENDGSMCLLDPFSSVEIPVPHQPDLLDEYDFVQKMVLSARPSETSDFIMMIIYGWCSDLAFWRSGDKSWNMIEIRNGAYRDVMYHDGHFYATDYLGRVWVFTFEGHNPPEVQMVTNLEAENSFDIELTVDKMFYILKTSQSLFIISREREAFEFSDEDNRPTYDTKKFQVYEVDMSKRTWTEINNLGNMAIFVGHNTTFAVDSSRFFGKIKGNHIYFTDDDWESYLLYEEEVDGKDMGTYNIETGTIESFFLGEMLLSKVCPSIWITPSCQLVNSCCCTINI